MTDRRIFNRFLFIVLIVNSFIVNSLEANDRKLHFDNISLDEGLSQTSVTSIVQDKHGFLWFGTEDGLNRYDGYEFKIFSTNDNDSTSLNNYSVWSLLVDFEGTLWVGTYGGLSRYNEKTETFTNFENNPKDLKSLSHNYVNTLFQSKDSTIWLGTVGGGLNKFDAETGKFKHFKHDPDDENSISGNSVFSIVEDSEGVFWIGTNKGLNRFDPIEEKFYKVAQIEGSVKCLYEDSHKTLWVGTSRLGLIELNINRDVVNHYKYNAEKNSLSNNAVVTIFEDGQNQFWIGSNGGGLNHFDRSSGIFTENKPDWKNPYSLADDRVMSIFEDDSGVLWVGTHSGGLNTYNRYSFTSTINRNIPDGSLLKSSYIRAFVDSTGSLWVGCEGGGVSKTDVDGNVTYYRHDPKNKLTLSNNWVSSMILGKDGYLWIGTSDGWLNRLNVNTGKVKRFLIRSKTESQNITYVNQGSDFNCC